MIQAILFDLDNCLAAADEAGPALLQPVFAAIAQAAAGRLSASRLEQMQHELWRRPFDVVARQLEFSAAEHQAGWDAYRTVQVSQRLRGYGDLGVLEQLEVLRFLVTTGFERLQESKVDALGIRPSFHGVHVDAIDQPNRQRRGKQGIFEQILAVRRLAPEQVLVVGDDPESEIKAGNALGIRTVQILRPGVERSPTAALHIHSLSELLPLLRS